MSTADTDRRWLWRLEGMLAVTATSAVHHATREELLAYLRGTCAHSWDLIPAGQYAEDPSTAPDLLQCRHCHRVRDLGTEQGDGVPGTRAAVVASAGGARPADVERVRGLIRAGDLPEAPSADAIRRALRISPAYARAARDALTSTPSRQAAGAAPGAQQ